MATNPDLYWPVCGGVKVLTVNNNTYISDQRGVFHNVLDADVAGMETAGCVTQNPEVTDQPTSQYSLGTTPPAVVDMYGPANVTVVGATQNYVSTAYGLLQSVLAADIATAQGLGFSLEAPYFALQTSSQYGNG